MHDPLGRRVKAEWREADRLAIVETALASGLDLIGGASNNDPVAAATKGAGELIAAAVKAGARRILIGVGGSATTDGGMGALEVLEPHSRLAGVELVVACDVTTRFIDAARTFAPQKGASESQVALLERRLDRLAQLYQQRFGVDVAAMSGSGAAGGLAGGLAAVGAELVSGFDLVADTVELDTRIEQADMVITGEGYLDAESYHGKVVGGVIEMARAAGIDARVVAGDVDEQVVGGEAAGSQSVTYESLVRRFGKERAWKDATDCITEVVADWLA